NLTGTCALAQPEYCSGLHRNPCGSTNLVDVCGNCSSPVWFSYSPNSNQDDCQVLYTSLQGASGAHLTSLSAGSVVHLNVVGSSGWEAVEGDRLHLVPLAAYPSSSEDLSAVCAPDLSNAGRVELVYYNGSSPAFVGAAGWYQSIPSLIAPGNG